MPRITNIRIRRGTALEWDDKNPVLDDGEFGYDKTNRLLKVGNGFDPWRSLSFIARINPIILNNNSSYMERLSIRSSYINFKQIQSIDIFSVPAGYFFSIDSLEILTTQIESPLNPPTISFGNNINSNEYCEPVQIIGSFVGDRHIIENPQNAVIENLNIVANIESPSSADIHGGFLIVSGNLIKI